MKFLSFGDLHYHKWTRFAEPDPDFVTTRVRRIHDSVMWVRDLILEHKPDKVVMNGDLIHNPRTCGFRIFNIAYQDMSAVARACQEVGATFDILGGNHDMLSRDMSDGTSSFSLQDLPATTLREDDVVAEGIRFLPYTKSRPARNADPAITFAHIDCVENVVQGHALGGWSIDDVGSSFIFSGHYHVPSTISTERTRLVYVGSLLPHSFVDASGHLHGIVIGRLVRGTVTWERLFNPHAVPFRKLEFSTVEEVREALANAPRHCYWSFRGPVELESQTLEWLAETAQEMWYEYRPVGSASVLKLKRSADQVTDSHLLEAYIEGHPAPSLDQDRLHQVGVQLMSGTYNLEEWV